MVDREQCHRFNAQQLDRLSGEGAWLSSQMRSTNPGNRLAGGLVMLGAKSAYLGGRIADSEKEGAMTQLKLLGRSSLLIPKGTALFLRIVRSGALSPFDVSSYLERGRRFGQDALGMERAGIIADIRELL